MAATAWTGGRDVTAETFCHVRMKVSVAKSSRLTGTDDSLQTVAFCPALTTGSGARAGI
jgi:hypothetical protein